MDNPKIYNFFNGLVQNNKKIKINYSNDSSHEIKNSSYEVNDGNIEYKAEQNTLITLITY